MFSHKERMMGCYTFLLVFLVTIPLGFFKPTPLDELNIKFNLDESPKGGHVGQHKYDDYGGSTPNVSKVTWSEMQINIWGADQCVLLEDHAVQLEECKHLCETRETCTAINHNSYTLDCVLRACPFPVPPPMEREGDYRGYYMLTRNDEEEDVSGEVVTEFPDEEEDVAGEVVTEFPGSTPNVTKVKWSEMQTNIWGADQCVLLEDHMVQLEDCKYLCERRQSCTAINYDSYTLDCVLRACPFPVPLPMERKGDYRGYYMLTRNGEEEDVDGEVVTEFPDDDISTQLPANDGKCSALRCIFELPGTAGECITKFEKDIIAIKMCILEDLKATGSTCAPCVCKVLKMIGLKC